MAKRARQAGPTSTQPKPGNRSQRHLLDAVHKDLRPWVKAAVKAGWTLRGSANGHVTMTAPDGYKCPVPTNANNRLRTVFRDQLRDHGVPLPNAH